MQLIVLLGSLVAVNLGLIYAGSEKMEANHSDKIEGVVEIEDVNTTENTSSEENSDTP